MLAAAWQRKTDTSITMQPMDENQFPDGLDMLRQNKEAEREQRELGAAIKASKKAYNAMKIALDIEQKFSSPVNVRGTTPERAAATAAARAATVTSHRGHLGSRSRRSP